MIDKKNVVRTLEDVASLIFAMYRDETDEQSIETRYDQYDAIKDAIALLKLQSPSCGTSGVWIDIWNEDDKDTSVEARCSICNRVSERPLGAYCKWCGTYMGK